MVYFSYLRGAILLQGPLEESVAMIGYKQVALFFERQFFERQFLLGKGN